MRRSLCWLLLPLLLFAFGCQGADDTVGGLRRDKDYGSIVSLSPSTTEIVGSLGVSKAFVGRTASCNWPEGSIKNIPIVASVKPDYEKLASIKPDLIVYDAMTYGPADVEKIKGLGFTTFEINADTVDGFCDQLYQLGSMLGQETTVSDYVDKIVAARASANGDPLTPTPKVVAMMAGSGGAEHYIAGTRSFLADAIKASGGEPVGPESDRFEKVNPEFLVAQNPDVIVVGVPIKDRTAAVQRVQAILGDPRLKTLAAVAKGRIVGFDEDILVRRGKRVDRLIENLHKAVAAKVQGS